MEIITSLDNEQVKYWKSLQIKKYRDRDNNFLVEGHHLVEEAIKTNQAISLIMTPDYNFSSQLPIKYVSKEIMKKLSNLETPSNIIALCSKKIEGELGSKIIILDSVQDPGNLGTIIRSAVAFNVDTIILGNDTVDLYNEKVIRSSQGMLFHINIIKKDIISIITLLKSQNYPIIATKIDHGIELKKLSIPSKYALILGNEGQGIKPDILNLCDEFIYLPMSKKCESLNVSIAASIIMYEFMAGEHD